MRLFDTNTVVMSVFAAALILGLSMCSESNKSSLYNLPIERKVAEITFHEYKNLQELQDVVGERRGFAVWSPNDNKCDIHFVAGDFETLGHEAYHCYKGKFHEE